MRTIDEAAAWLKAQDEETAMTKTALRRLVTTGQLPAVRVGQKYLINLDTLENFLQGDGSTHVIPLADYGRRRTAV